MARHRFDPFDVKSKSREISNGTNNGSLQGKIKQAAETKLAEAKRQLKEERREQLKREALLKAKEQAERDARAKAKQQFQQQVKAAARERTEQRILADAEHGLRARRYSEIKAKVADFYRDLSEQSRSPMSHRPVDFDLWEDKEHDLAFAAIAPASTEKERNEALILIKTSGCEDVVSAYLLDDLPTSRIVSKRRTNILHALKWLGKSDEVADFISEHGQVDHSSVLEWEVLPPGWWNDRRYTDQLTSNTQAGLLLLERLRIVDSLNPSERWRSQERLGSDPYWVFVFPHHVVAECPTHGNAMYVIKGTSGWRNILNRSKADLLKAFPERVVRIMHRGAWESRLRRLMQVKS